MRKITGVFTLAALLSLSGEARSAGWPSFGLFSGHARGPIASELDDSPLVPEITYFTFQKSQAKLPPCSGRDLHRSESYGEVPNFPPLPYSHKAMGMGMGMPVGNAPAPAGNAPAPAGNAAAPAGNAAAPGGNKAP